MSLPSSPKTTVQPDLERLRQIIKDRSFARGDFVLSSGIKSPFYFDLKPTMMDPEGGELCALAFLEALENIDADYIGGLEMGAVPIITVVSALSSRTEKRIPALFVRKASKGHGTKKLVEGLGPSESLVGKRVLVADDVTTSGKSVLQAVEAFRAAGAIVDEAISLVDRQEGANELLSANNVRLSSIFSVKDFA